jgi:tRNA pseudouridine55 synthase
MKPSPFHGFLVVDKPGGMTSRDVVTRAQQWFPRGTKLGHTGTLDPLATGVLVLAVGLGTRLTEYVQDMDKIYRSTFRLGARSDTDDADGTITPTANVTPPGRAAVERQLQGFIGDIEQVPPAFSAAKVTGRRAYDLARRGEVVSLRPRRVRVHAIDLRSYDYPRLELEVRCGKGTYIRALARDLGQCLGCGGYIETLRRTVVGCFTADEGVALDADKATAQRRLQPLAAGLSNLPAVVLDEETLTRFRRGQAVALPRPCESREAAVLDSAGHAVGVATIDVAGGVIAPVKVLAWQ